MAGEGFDRLADLLSQLLTELQQKVESLTEDAAHTSGEGGALLLTVRRDADTTLVDADGDRAPLQVNAAGALKVAGGGGGTQYTEGDVDATITGTAAMMEVAANTVQPVQGTVADGLLVNLGTNNDVSLNAGANNIGDMDVLTVPAPLSTSGGGTEATALRVTVASDSTGVLSIDDNAGSLTVDQGAAGTAWEVVGDVAADAVAAGNPVLLGAQAETMADSAPGTRVSADLDAVTVAADRDGAIYTHPHGPQTWSYHENSSSALTDTEVHAAPAAGLSLYVGTVIFSTGAATAWNIFFEEGATTVLGPWYLEAVAGRGAPIVFNPPKKITAATALTVTTSAAIAHSIDITGTVAPG